MRHRSSSNATEPTSPLLNRINRLTVVTSGICHFDISTLYGTLMKTKELRTVGESERKV